MYIGMLMVGMSLCLALGTWLLPVAASLMFTLLALCTRTEERYLIERFGYCFVDLVVASDDNCRHFLILRFGFDYEHMIK